MAHVGASTPQTCMRGRVRVTLFLVTPRGQVTSRQGSVPRKLHSDSNTHMHNAHTHAHTHTCGCCCCCSGGRVMMTVALSALHSGQRMSL